ncbi:retrovirus-related pol polyprotein from transposon TNT 1-94 [Tanacetum coccineum]
MRSDGMMPPLTTASSHVSASFGSIAGGLDHVNPVIRLPLEHGISRVLGKVDHPNPSVGTDQFSCKFLDMGDDVDISALTIEQYLALIQDNNRPGIVKPKIGDDVEFETNSNFMRVFPITLKGRTSRWKKGLPAGVINTWDLLEKEFTWQYCSPYKTVKKLKEIHNFIQEMCKTLYQAWERYNDKLFKCPQHNLNNHQKARTTMGKENMKEPVPRDLPPTPFLGHLKEQIGIPYRTRETVCMIENPGEVHKMKAQEDEGDMDVDIGDDVDISALTIEQYLALIQDNNRPGIVKPKIGDDVEFEINSNFMRELRRKLFAGTDDEDAHKHGRTLRWKKGLPAGVINTWDLLEKEFIWQYCSPYKTAKKLKEIHNFKQEMCETLYQAWESPNNVDTIQASFKGAHLTKECPLKKEDKTVEQREKFKARTTMGKENMKEPVPRDLPPTPFLGHLKEQIGIPYRTRETVCMIENPGEVHKMKAQEDEGDMDVG